MDEGPRSLFQSGRKSRRSKDPHRAVRRGRPLTLENRRWKAFLRLTGETMVERDDEILDEFKGVVKALKRVGGDYSIIVNVEGGREESFLGGTGPIGATEHSPPSSRRRNRST